VKLVREYINEKFTADSDPIRDLGIGGINFEEIALKTARTGDTGLKVWLDYLHNIIGKTITGMFARQNKKIKTFQIYTYTSYRKGSRLVLFDGHGHKYTVLKKQNYIIR
jgi:hypothetical protein